MKKRRKHSEQEMRSLYDRYTTESIRLKDLLAEAKISRSVFSRWRRKFDALTNPSVEAKLSKADFLRLKQHAEHENFRFYKSPLLSFSLFFSTFSLLVRTGIPVFNTALQ